MMRVFKVLAALTHPGIGVYSQNAQMASDRSIHVCLLEVTNACPNTIRAL